MEPKFKVGDIVEYKGRFAKIETIENSYSAAAKKNLPSYSLAYLDEEEKVTNDSWEFKLAEYVPVSYADNVFVLAPNMANILYGEDEDVDK